MAEYVCHRCEAPAEFFLYSAYDAAPGAVHPLVHRYPGAMYRACSRHVAVLLASDAVGTPRWVVSREPLRMVPSRCQEHSWRLEGNDNYEPFHWVCEDCGEEKP